MPGNKKEKGKATMARIKPSIHWKVKFSDGFTKIFESTINPRGTAASFLMKEKVKGRDHGLIISIDKIPEAALNKPVPATNENREMQTTLEKEQSLNVEVPEIDTSSEEKIPDEDKELYVLIRATSDDIDKVIILLAKLYEFATDTDEIFDDVFLLEFVKRIKRALYIIGDDIENIENNLKGETNNG